MATFQQQIEALTARVIQEITKKITQELSGAKITEILSQTIAEGISPEPPLIPNPAEIARLLVKKLAQPVPAIQEADGRFSVEIKNRRYSAARRRDLVRQARKLGVQL